MSFRVQIKNSQIASYSIIICNRMQVFKATEADLEGMCQVEFACYKVMYEENPQKKPIFRAMLKRRFAIARQWMWVLKENGKVLGSITGQPTKKEVDNFISWQKQTDNETLQTTFDPTGDKIYIVNLDAITEATAKNGQSLLISELYRQIVKQEKKLVYFQSRLPQLRQYVRQRIGIEKWNGMSDPDKKQILQQYVREKVSRNGQEIPYDRMIRFFSAYELKLHCVLLNAFDDPQSLNCGAIFIDYRVKESFKRFSVTSTVSQAKFNLKSIRQFGMAILNDKNHNLIQEKLLTLSACLNEILQKLQQAVLSPPNPNHHEVMDNQIYIKFIYTIQEFMEPSKVDYHLRQIFYDHSSMLKSERSLKYIDLWIQKGVEGSEPAMWNPADFILNENEPNYGFRCWSDFFTRKIKLERFPVDENSNVIVMPCECYPIFSPPQPFENIPAKDKFWLKNSHYSLYDILNVKQKKNEEIAQKFIGGTIFQAYLDYWCYHRWHAPISGVVEDIYTIPGYFFLLKPETENPSALQFAIQQPFLSCTATRQIIILKSDNQMIGRVILVAVSMAEVSTCVSTVSIGERVKKGQQIGHFELGSSICLIFERGCRLDFFTQNLFENHDGQLMPKLVKVNSSLCKLKYEPKL